MLAAKVSNAIQAEPLTVLVMGPGEFAEGGGKRSQILQHLRENAPHDSVTFPEELIEADPKLHQLSQEKGYFAVELELAMAADAVIMLMMKSRRVTGAPTEAAQFLTFPVLRQKFFIVYPKEWNPLLDGRKTYQLDEVARLDVQQRFPYTASQLQSCSAIRGRVEDWLLGVRLEKRRRQSVFG